MQRVRLEVFVTPPKDGDDWIVDVEVVGGRFRRIGRSENECAGQAFKESLLTALAYESIPPEHVN